MILYIKDLFFALWAWVTIWQMDKAKIERRKRFLEDGIEDERKKRLPYKMLMAAYKRKLNDEL